ncbi:MAG: MlaE family ABC transporter permease, partial [Rhodothermales bacterium]
RVTEQIDALEVAALKPFHFLIITRTLACMLMFPILTLWTDAVALFGGYIESYLASGMDYRIFLSSAFESLRISDVVVGKTSIFGFIVAMVSCYLGFNVSGGTREVGQAAMRAVVGASLFILLTDVVIVRLSIMIFGDVGT